METQQIRLTKALERLKVNVGTVVETRINKGDFGIQQNRTSSILFNGGQANDRFPRSLKHTLI